MTRHLGLLAASVLLACCGSLSAAERPNIIYILADDLGYGDLGCYGQQRIQTPNLDRMAAEGLRFTQHYAGSTVCAPSRCVLMTGKHLGHAFIRGNARDDLRPEDVTVAEVLREAGYRTALTGKWGLGHEGGTGLPARQGFDEFFGYLNQRHAHNYYPTFLVRNEARVPLRNVVPEENSEGSGVASKKLDYSHDLIVDEALKFIDERKDERFFLYLAVTIPHANNEAGGEGMEVPDLGPYADEAWPLPARRMAAMVSRLDGDVGRILARLKQHGIDDQTLVMFSSDNGPHAEGGNNPNFFDSNGPLRGIKRDLYEGGIRVPLIARWPGKIAPGDSDHISYHGDLMATVADLAGTETPGDLDSISFAPTLLGRADKQPQHKYLYWEFYEGGSRQAVRQGKWKAVRQPLFTGPIELYDLEADLGETRNVAAEHPEIVSQMAQAMHEAHTPAPRWSATLKKNPARGVKRN